MLKAYMFTFQCTRRKYYETAVHTLTAITTAQSVSSLSKRHNEKRDSIIITHRDLEQKSGEMVETVRRKMAEKVKMFTATRLSLTMFQSFVIICLLGMHLVHSQAEYFSSIDKIKMLAFAEKDLLQWFKNFTQAQAEDFAVFRKFIAKVKEDHAVASEDPEAYLSNPINAFKLIKRSVDEWAQITEYVKNNTQLYALKTNLTNLEKQMKLPDSSDLQGAVKGLGRLQTMYNLSSNDLADGVINDIYYGTDLSVSDCFEIGANLFEAREYHLATEWFEKVLEYLKADKNTNIADSKIEEYIDELTKIGYIAADLDVEHKDYKREKKIVQEMSDEDDYEYDDEELFNEVEGMLDTDKDLGDNSEAEKSILPADGDSAMKLTNATSERRRVEDTIFIETLEYLSLGKHELGQRKEAISYIQQILDLYPEHSFKDMEIYMNMKEPKNETNPDSLRALQNRVWFANYTRLCQGKQLPQKKFHKLTCTLDTRNHPLFILAPLKRELLLADPEIVVYYDLLSDIQMLDILKESYLYMFRSKVGSGSSSKVRDVRVSQQTWLDYNSSTLKYIYNTVSAISGYNLNNAELMQVANYGIGGQYDPHHDFTRQGVTEKHGKLIGDRIATHLFYISEVHQGGNTVFPLLNVYSKPVKGSMLMWHNLHKSLDPDWRTFHAGCPVIMGTKRITNVWVHSAYQDHKRPCDVIPDGYKSAPLAKYFDNPALISTNESLLHGSN